MNESLYAENPILFIQNPSRQALSHQHHFLTRRNTTLNEKHLCTIPCRCLQQDGCSPLSAYGKAGRRLGLRQCAGSDGPGLVLGGGASFAAPSRRGRAEFPGSSRLQWDPAQPAHLASAVCPAGLRGRGSSDMLSRVSGGDLGDALVAAKVARREDV